MWLMSKTVKCLLLCPRPLPLFLAILLAVISCAFACEEDGWHPLKLLGPTHEQRFVESDCYSDRNQCMAYPGRAQISSYGLRFRLEGGEASCPDGYLICYESQLDGRSTQTGLVSENAYRINNVKRGNEVADECRAARKKHLKGKPTFLVPQWHGLRVKKENGSKEFNIELSYTNRTYKIETEKEFTLQLGNRSHLLTQVMVYNEEDGTESPVNLEKNGTKFLADVSRGGRMQRYAGLWSLAVDLLPLEIHNSVKLYVKRNSSECKLHAWLNHPTDDPGEMRPMPPTTTTTEAPKYECKYEINAKAGENVSHYGIRLRDPDMPSDASDWLSLEIDTESGISQVITKNNGVERVHKITCFGKVDFRNRDTRETSAQLPLSQEDSQEESQEEPTQEPSSQESAIQESPTQEHLENPPRNPIPHPRKIHKCHDQGMLTFEQSLADQLPTLNNAAVTFYLNVREFFVNISMNITDSNEERIYHFGYFWPNDWWNELPAEKNFKVEIFGNLKIVGEPKCSTGKMKGGNEAEYNKINTPRNYMYKFAKELGDNSKIRFSARVQKPERGVEQVGGFLVALLNNAFEINKYVGEVAMGLQVDVTLNKEKLWKMTQGKVSGFKELPDKKLSLTFGQFFECEIVAKPPQSFVITFRHADEIESLEVQSYLPFWAVTHLNIIDNAVFWDAPIVDYGLSPDSFTRVDLPAFLNVNDKINVTLRPSQATEAQVYLLHKVRKFDLETMKKVGGAISMCVNISRDEPDGIIAKISASSMGSENLTFANHTDSLMKLTFEENYPDYEIVAKNDGFQIWNRKARKLASYLTFPYYLPLWTVNHIWVAGNFSPTEIQITPVQMEPDNKNMQTKLIRVQDSLLLKSRELTMNGVVKNDAEKPYIEIFFLHDAPEWDAEYGNTALHVDITDDKMQLEKYSNGMWVGPEPWVMNMNLSGGQVFKLSIRLSKDDGHFEVDFTLNGKDAVNVQRKDAVNVQPIPCAYPSFIPFLPPWAIQYIKIYGNIGSDYYATVEERNPKCGID